MAKKTLFRLHFETEFRIVGLFCQERDYRLSWLINNHLNFNLRRVADFEFLPSKSKEFTAHSVFMHEVESLQQTFFLVNNRGNNGAVMFGSPSGLDFLMLIRADGIRFNNSDLLKKFRSIPQITAAYVIDEALGRNKEGFLYDFEMFLAQELKM
jgi:hypothetical protein